MYFLALKRGLSGLISGPRISGSRCCSVAAKTTHSWDWGPRLTPLLTGCTTSCSRASKAPRIRYRSKISYTSGLLLTRPPVCVTMLRLKGKRDPRLEEFWEPLRFPIVYSSIAVKTRLSAVAIIRDSIIKPECADVQGLRQCRLTGQSDCKYSHVYDRHRLQQTLRWSCAISFQLFNSSLHPTLSLRNVLI